jgi:tRNA(adenine34) deaminase
VQIVTSPLKEYDIYMLEQKNSENHVDYKHFMGKALIEAGKALSAGEFPVGCVIVHGKKILATGYRKGTLGNFPNEIEHAEITALKQLTDLKINTHKNKVVLFTTLEPCIMCLGAMILSGISEIVYAYEDIMGGGTNCDLTKLTPLYKNSGISIVPSILRKESLKLFKAFFKNPKNAYWRGSLLAEYTLSQ